MIVLNQITNLNLSRVKEENQLELTRVADNIIETLVGSDKCLGYEEAGSVEPTTHRFIDYKKLQDFPINYSDVEPECARNFEYRYRVKIDKLNLTRQILQMPGDIPFPGNRDIVLILDNSYSMRLQGKMDAARQATLEFIKCADDTDRLAIVKFSGDQSNWCKNEEIAPLTYIGTNRTQLSGIVSGIVTKEYIGTPLYASLKMASDILSTQSTDPDRVKMIVMMTDGQESCCPSCSSLPSCCGDTPCLQRCYNSLCNSINQLVSPGIPVFTIGFMIDATAEAELRCVSNKTNGKYFYADISKLSKVFCEIAGGKPEEEKPETWHFGVQNHSLGDAFKSSLTISTAVSIKISDVKTQPGLITLTIYSGELEELSGIIDKSCLSGIESDEQISLSYATYAKSQNDKNYICMSYKNGDFCLTLSCAKEIVFPKLSPGTYKIKVIPNGKVEVRV